MVELKRCPFCGLAPEAEVIAWRSGKDNNKQNMAVRIRCISESHKASVIRYVAPDGDVEEPIPLAVVEDTIAEAVKAWNLRESDWRF